MSADPSGFQNPKGLHPRKAGRGVGGAQQPVRPGSIIHLVLHVVDAAGGRGKRKATEGFALLQWLQCSRRFSGLHAKQRAEVRCILLFVVLPLVAYCLGW